MIPGEYHVASEPIDYNGGYEAISLEVNNVGDRDLLFYCFRLSLN